MANSIMTNTSAMTALKTLNATNRSLEKTQSHISTGYRVAEASDNAAYWSISTTMRSDNKALSTVNDALGLGKSTVDVAYTALNSSKTVLDEIKTKLVAAKQPGVDKSKVQSEITQLQNQLKGIASAASFSGSNWLSVDSGSSAYNSVQKVVASFSRGTDGALSVGVIDVDISKVALFNAGADSGSGATLKGVGLLDKGIGNSSSATLAATGTAGGTEVAATSGGFTSAALDWSGLVATDKVVLGVKIDGGTAVTGIEVNAGASIDEFITNFNNTLSLDGVSAAKDGSNKIKFTSDKNGTTSNFEITAVTYKDAGGTAKTPTTGLAATAGTAGTVGKTSMTEAFSSVVTLDSDDSISFDLAVDGGNAKRFTIDKAAVDARLSGANGKIDTAANFALVLNSVLTGAGVSVTESAGKLTFASTSTGSGSSAKLSNLSASNGGNAFGVMDINITNASSEQLDKYISGVDKMAESVTTAASDLGAVKSRITMQTDFVKNLMDAIDRGVGTLVDADMNEESTRLQALQVQQQLGIQALSMANSSSQSILSLFRG